MTADAVIDTLRAAPCSTAQDIATLMGTYVWNVRSVLTRLRKRGVVESLKLFPDVASVWAVDPAPWRSFGGDVHATEQYICDMIDAGRAYDVARKESLVLAARIERLQKELKATRARHAKCLAMARQALSGLDVTASADVIAGAVAGYALTGWLPARESLEAVTLQTRVAQRDMDKLSPGWWHFIRDEFRRIAGKRRLPDDTWAPVAFEAQPTIEAIAYVDPNVRGYATVTPPDSDNCTRLGRVLHVEEVGHGWVGLVYWGDALRNEMGAAK